jgi:hypothetical protein
LGDERSRNLTWRGKGGEGAHGVRVNVCAIPWCVLACSPSLIPQPSSDTRRWQRASRRVAVPSCISAPVPSIFFKEASRRRAKRHDRRWCKGDADLGALRSAIEIGRSGMAHTEFAPLSSPSFPVARFLIVNRPFYCYLQARQALDVLPLKAIVSRLESFDKNVRVLMQRCRGSCRIRIRPRTARSLWPPDPCAVAWIGF